MIGLINNLKNKYNLQVQYLCCNNTGENVAFKKACKQEGLGVDFEYTAPGMPQLNEQVEIIRVRAMLHHGKISAYLQNGLWAEAANTIMLLENNILTLDRTLSPFQQFLGKGKRSILT